MFGSNNWGQLGLGSKITVTKPTCVKGQPLFSAELCPLAHVEGSETRRDTFKESQVGMDQESSEGTAQPMSSLY